MFFLTAFRQRLVIHWAKLCPITGLVHVRHGDLKRLGMGLDAASGGKGGEGSMAKRQIRSELGPNSQSKQSDYKQTDMCVCE